MRRIRVFQVLGLCCVGLYFGCATVERLSPADMPDAADLPDAMVNEPDATLNEPDATVNEPDATVGEPDATVNEPDAMLEPACDDGVQNGDETGVDCGGTVCAPCATESICDRQPGLWCNAFEDDSFTTTPGSDGNVEIETTDRYHGDSALRTQSAGAGQAASVQATYSPVDSGELYLRAYLKVSGSFTATHADIFTLDVPATADASAEHCAVALQSGNILLWCISDGQMALVAATPPGDQWLCVEWKLTIGATGSSELFVDGASVAMGTGTTLLSRPFEEARIGVPYTSAAQSAMEVLLDEVVIDNKPIGCD